ncbi:hypothetical protein QR680_012053 [Steinernema hermaphroditum]|uniref:Uncharacterized protein n=1 Tax=Steinernema hermaphroditum TaxID=289476 RepID=A0AA39I2C2_9BILA|nr:hypothetical protein QR680_012053 [Steinernema hermaphroditum]
MLFGSDPVARINITEPLCVFLVSSDRNHLSKLMFTSTFTNGTCATVKASDFAHWDNSTMPWYDAAVSYGKYCFDDATESVVLGRGDLYTDLNPTSVRWREIILLFLEKSQLKGHCKEGNVYYPLNSGDEVVSASADCPAFILTPTLANKTILLDSKPGSVCPVQWFSALDKEDYNLPNAEIDVTTVQNGLHNISDTAVTSFSSWNVPDSLFLRSAVMVTANVTDWRPLVSTANQNGDQTGPLTCYLSRHLTTYTSGHFDSDPYGVEEFRYTFTFFFPDPEMTFHIAPYDAGCVNLTLTEFNATDRRVFSNVESIVVQFHRTDPIKCAYQGVSIEYSLQDSPPVTPTDSPVPANCIAPSSGVAISSDLPFMLFGSDNVSLIILREPTCVAVDSSNLVDMSPFALTSLFSNGGCSSIRWNDLSNTELFCFDATTTTVLLHRGDIFDRSDEVHNEWRSVILMFLARETLKGECQDGNIFRVAEMTNFYGFNVSADCPAFLLMPNGASQDIATYLCPAMWFGLDIAPLPQNTRVDLFTVQNGLLHIEQPHLATYTSDRPPDWNQLFLRNAVMVTTNITTSVQLNGLSTSSLDDTNTPLRCGLSVEIDPYDFVLTDNLISSDPYGVETFDYTISQDGEPNTSMHFFLIAPYSDLCVDLELICTHVNKTKTSIKNPHSAFTFSNWSQVVITFSRRAHFGCSTTSYFSMHFSISLPPSDVASTAHLETTSSLSTTTPAKTSTHEIFSTTSSSLSTAHNTTSESSSTTAATVSTPSDRASSSKTTKLTTVTTTKAAAASQYLACLGFMLLVTLFQ